MTEAGKMHLKNPLSFRYLDDNFIESDAVKIGKTFMDYLKKTKDPRIHVYCSLKDGNTEFDKQFGLPNGYDSHTIADAPSGSFCRLRKYFQLQYQYNFEIGCPYHLPNAI